MPYTIEPLVKNQAILSFYELLAPVCEKDINIHDFIIKSHECINPWGNGHVRSVAYE